MNHISQIRSFKLDYNMTFIRILNESETDLYILKVVDFEERVSSFILKSLLLDVFLPFFKYFPKNAKTVIPLFDHLYRYVPVYYLKVPFLFLL